MKTTEKWRQKMSHYVTRGAEVAPIRPEYLIATIDELADDDAVVCADTGTAVIWTARYITAQQKRNIFGSPIGLTGIRVEDPRDVRDSVAKFLATPGPALLDAVVEPNALSLPPHISFGEAEGFSLGSPSRGGGPAVDAVAVGGDRRLGDVRVWRSARRGVGSPRRVGHTTASGGSAGDGSSRNGVAAGLALNVSGLRARGCGQGVRRRVRPRHS